jgi:hypothetical protein
MKKRIIIDEFVLTIFSDGRIDWDGFEKYFSWKDRSHLSKLLKKSTAVLIKERTRSK